MMSFLKMFVFLLVMFTIMLQSIKSMNIPLNDIKASDKLVYDKWMNLDAILKGFVKSGMKKILPAMIDFSSKVNLSSTCVKQGLTLFNGIKRLDTWAMSFIDASGKSIDGLLSYSASSLGDYKQCLDTVAKRKVENKEVIMFEGKYCIVELKPPLPEQKDEYFEHGLKDLINITKSASGLIRDFASMAHGFYAASLQLGICVPSGCSLEDVNEVVRSAASELYIDAHATYCEIRTEKPFTTGNIVAISMFSFIGLLVLTGTVLDFYFRRKKIQLRKKAVRAVLAFSFEKNVGDLLKPELSKDNIPCLHGIRFLTVTWILACHVLVFASKNPQLHHHIIELIEATKSFGMQIVLNTPFSVDTFFVIGGLVNCYVSVKDHEKNKSRSFLWTIKHRLWRILPTHVAAMLSFLLLDRLLKGPGAHSEVITNMAHACYDVWWRNLIFINNYWPTEHSCLPHAWYLAAEFQLFLVSWGIIKILLRFPKVGLVLNTLFVAASVAFSITWVEVHKMHPMFIATNLNPKQFQIIEDWYVQTMVHAGPYFVGVLTGYMLAKKKELNISKCAKCFGWLLSTFVAMLVIFCTKRWNNGVTPTKVEDILYSGFSKLGFSLSIAWVITCCSRGYGGIINSILSWKAWIPLSRLVFGLYLLSPTVLFSSLGTSTTLRESSTKEWVWRFFGDYFVSIVLAFLLYISVENPFVTVEKIITAVHRTQCVEQNGNKGETVKNGNCIKTDTVNRTQEFNAENVC